MVQMKVTDKLEVTGLNDQENKERGGRYGK